jgi:hypothetical protein
MDMVNSLLQSEAQKQAQQGMQSNQGGGRVKSNNSASDASVAQNDLMVNQNWDALLQALQATSGGAGGAVSGDWSRLMM